MSAYEKQQHEDYQRYQELCSKHGFRPMPFELFQLGYQRKAA
jgi:hypothetical protein